MHIVSAAYIYFFIHTYSDKQAIYNELQDYPGCGAVRDPSPSSYSPARSYSPTTTPRFTFLHACGGRGSPVLVRAAVAAPARPPHAPSLSQILPHHDATVQFLARLRAAATPFVLVKSPAAVAAPAPPPPHSSPRLPPPLLLLMLPAPSSCPSSSCSSAPSSSSSSFSFSWPSSSSSRIA